MSAKLKYGFTLIELLFCIIILSVLTLTLISAINYNISANQKITAKHNAHLLADSILQSNTANLQSIEFQNIEYQIHITLEKKKIKDIINIPIKEIEIPAIDIPVKKVEIKWTVGNEPYSISVEKLQI